jgi:hypothetical protein
MRDWYNAKPYLACAAWFKAFSSLALALTTACTGFEGRRMNGGVRHGDAQREAALLASYNLLAQTENDPAGPEPALWERRNKAFHEALIAGFNSTWSKYLLSILYRHTECYRNINGRLTAAHTSGRDVHREHEDIFRATKKRARPWHWKRMCG